jgi:hypothetical protein
MSNRDYLIRDLQDAMAAMRRLLHGNHPFAHICAAEEAYNRAKMELLLWHTEQDWDLITEPATADNLRMRDWHQKAIVEFSSPF